MGITQERLAKAAPFLNWDTDPHPVVANGRLYLRDQDLLFCFEVKDPAASVR